MTGADAARDAMQRAAREAYRPIHDAGTTYVKAHQAITAATDMEATAAQMLELIVAAEKLEDDAKASHKALREALAAYLEETGAPEVQTMHHKASMDRNAQFISIDQPDLLPEQYWNKPTPNRAAIKEVLEKGDDVPGAALIRPNARHLVIRARK